jgi:hypothetical protein
MIEAANDEQLPGIYPVYQAFYIQSMLFCTRSALRSVETLNRTLERVRDDAAEDSNVERLVLDSLQNIVGQGAALSRYFWPSREADPHGARGRELRKSFYVHDSNPLRNRDLRNAIEHFDERLDKYLAGNIAGYVVPEYVGHTPDPGGVPLHFFRGYYADAGVFELLGRRYEIEALVSEIDRVHQLLVEYEKSGGKFPIRGEKSQSSS